MKDKFVFFITIAFYYVVVILCSIFNFIFGIFGNTIIFNTSRYLFYLLYIILPICLVLLPIFLNIIFKNKKDNIITYSFVFLVLFIILFFVIDIGIKNYFSSFSKDKWNNYNTNRHYMINDIEQKHNPIGKNKEEICALYDFLKIKSDALFAVQSDSEENYSFEYKNSLVRVVQTSTRGVSKNRNILLENANGEVCVCIDDDCPVVDNYLEIVEKFYSENKCDAAMFNGIVALENNRIIHNKETKKIKNFNDISYGGGPGLTYRPEVLRAKGLKFNESFGTPNYLYAGEDSLFLYSLSKAHINFYRVKTPLFIIEQDLEKSSYFKGFDEQFITTKGAVCKIVHPVLYPIYRLYYVRPLHARTKLAKKDILKWFKNGFKYIKHGKVIK